MNKKYFHIEESASNSEYNLIKVRDDLPYVRSTRGSLTVLQARLLGLSWADFCRFCRDTLDAKVYGKNSMYPTIYFPKNSEKVNKYLDLLNTRMEYVASLLDKREIEKGNGIWRRDMDTSDDSNDVPW